MTNPTTIYDKRNSLFVILITPTLKVDTTIVLLPHHNKTWGSEKATTIIPLYFSLVMVIWLENPVENVEYFHNF